MNVVEKEAKEILSNRIRECLLMMYKERYGEDYKQSNIKEINNHEEK